MESKMVSPSRYSKEEVVNILDAFHIAIKKLKDNDFQSTKFIETLAIAEITVEIDQSNEREICGFAPPRIFSRCLLATLRSSHQQTALSLLLAENLRFPSGSLANLVCTYVQSLLVEDSRKWLGGDVCRVLTVQLIRQLLLNRGLNVFQRQKLLGILNKLKPRMKSAGDGADANVLFGFDPGPCVRTAAQGPAKKRRLSEPENEAHPNLTNESVFSKESQQECVEVDVNVARSSKQENSIAGCPLPEELKSLIYAQNTKFAEQGISKSWTPRQSLSCGEELSTVLRRVLQENGLEGLRWALGHEGLGPALTSVGDDVTAALSKAFVTEDLSHTCCTVFIQAVFLPKGKMLTSPASRLLVAALTDLCTSRPDSVAEGLIRPLLGQKDAEAIGSAQCELCTRLIKGHLPLPVLGNLMKDLCQPEGCYLNDLTAQVLTAVLQRKPQLTPSAAASLISKLESVITSTDPVESVGARKSVKVATLFHTLINKYGPEVKDNKEIMLRLLSKCENFLVKSSQTALQKL